MAALAAAAAAAAWLTRARAECCGLVKLLLPVEEDAIRHAGEKKSNDKSLHNITKMVRGQSMPKTKQKTRRIFSLFLIFENVFFIIIN